MSVFPKSQLFHIIEGSAVILRSRGTYQQVSAYHRCGEIYAKRGSGFIKLTGKINPGNVFGTTTAPNVHYEHVEGSGIVEEKGKLRFAENEASR